MEAARTELNLEVAGVQTHIRVKQGEGTPLVLFHGVPNNSAMWEPFIDRLPGPVYAADMPGFGASARPDPAAFDGSAASLIGWAEALVDELGLERYSAVVHDWGSVGLVAAARRPARVERLVAFNPVPYDAEYSWHWVASIWRRNLAGELFNRLWPHFRPGAGLIFRQARPGFKAMPRRFLDDALEPWDAGTGDAILRLYRSADPPVLAEHA